MTRWLVFAALAHFGCADAPIDAETEGEDDAAAPLPAPGSTGSPGAPGSGRRGPEKDVGVAEGDPLDDPRAEFCAGEGPIVEVGDEREVIRETCAGELAETVFTNALCTCEDTRLAGYLLTRGFDSRDGPPPDDDDALGTGAPVGMNGTYAVGAGFTDVGGSFAVSGVDDLTFIGYLKVEGDLRLAGTTLVPGYTRVGRDAWLGRDYTGGPITVGRDLRHAGNLLAIPDVGGEQRREAVRVEPPCPCDRLVDVAPIIERVRARNDNALVDLADDALSETVGSSHIELPCGRYHLDEITSVGDVQVDVTGRVVLAVSGAIAALGNVEFSVAPDAELDVFVQGPLTQIGHIAFGDRDRPAAVRIYVAGADDITLVGAAAFVGNLYAPRARVTAPGFVDAYGSFFVRSFDAAGFARIRYDRAITDPDCGEEEPPGPEDGPPADDAPPPRGNPDVPCSVCNFCLHGFACVDEFCQPCRVDADCCGQQACDEGRCVNL